MTRTRALALAALAGLLAPALAPAPAAAQVVVTAYGAIPGDGLDDTAAFRRAMADAMARKHTLDVPAGAYNVNFTTAAPSLAVTGNLTVIRRGPATC
jgi:hypothetical protein